MCIPLESVSKSIEVIGDHWTDTGMLIVRIYDCISMLKNENNDKYTFHLNAIVQIEQTRPTHSYVLQKKKTHICYKNIADDGPHKP